MMATMPLITAETVKIYPTADAYTDSSKPGNNFNTQTLRAGNDVNHGKHRTYLKFDLSSVSGTINSAKLSIDPLGPVGFPEIGVYYISSDSWSESSVTWNNAPSYSTFVDSKLVYSPDRKEFDLMPVINEQDDTLSLVLKSEQEITSNLYVQFFSSEYPDGETYWPYIEINYGAGIECETGADTGGDGDINLSELLAYINKWKIGDVEILDLLNAIGFWKAGEGC